MRWSDIDQQDCSVARALSVIGDRWMTGHTGPPVELRHRACGHVMLPELACPECGDWLEARDVEAAARR